MPWIVELWLQIHEIVFSKEVFTILYVTLIMEL